MDTKEILDEQGRQYLDQVERMKSYKDPLLDDFEKELEKENTSPNSRGTNSTKGDKDEDNSSSGEDDSGSDEESSDEEINFPRDNA